MNNSTERLEKALYEWKTQGVMPLSSWQVPELVAHLTAAGFMHVEDHVEDVVLIIDKIIESNTREYNWAKCIESIRALAQPSDGGGEG